MVSTFRVYPERQNPLKNIPNYPFYLDEMLACYYKGEWAQTSSLVQDIGQSRLFFWKHLSQVSL
jgi:hypothetical protein